MGSDDTDDQPREQGILGPDELDISDHPKVESLEEGRYVVAADGPDVDPDEQLEDPGFDDDTELPPQTTGTPADEPPADTTQQSPTEQSSTTEPVTDGEDEDDESASPAATDDDDNETEPPTGAAAGSTTDAPPPANETDDEPDETAESADTAAAGETAPTRDEAAESAAGTTETADPPAVELTQQTVSQFLAESLAKTEESYGFDATVNIEGDVKRGRMSSDDIAETLEGLLRWYARQTTDEVDPEAALGIILAGSSLEVEYPVQSAYAMLKEYGLQPDDSISELLAAVRKEGAFRVPPSKNQ